MGMALDESVDNLEEMESNGIPVYIEPKLKEFLQQFQTITIDYVSGPQGSGYMVTVGAGCGEAGSCSSESCG